MGALFPATTYNVAAVAAAGADLMTSPLGLIAIAVPVGFVVARKGFSLLKGIVRG